MSDDSRKGIEDQLKRLKRLTTRFTLVADKMEKQIKGIVKSDKQVKNLHRRKDD